MPYVYEDAEELEKHEAVGTRQCVALIQYYTKNPKAPAASTWKQGDDVKGNSLLKKGTAIATFVDGRYPNKAHGNHAAFYIGQNAGGILVVDQWSSSKTIRKRLLTFKGKDKNGNYVSPSDNGDAFSAIK